LNSVSWKNVAESVGITAIIASLVFVGLQLRQTQDIANSEVAAKLLIDDFEWVNLVNQNRDVWIRGNRGDDLDELEQSAYRDLALIRDSIAFFRYRQLDDLDISGAIVVADFATHLHQSPGARREWNRRIEHYKKYRDPLLLRRVPEMMQANYQYNAMVLGMVEELDRLYGQ
jgi:hypothetical protein